MNNTNKERDPFPYVGPIQRADGTRPYNHYLWPTESWWAVRDLDQHFDGRWHFGIVALMDGRFSTCGEVWSIEENSDDGRQCVYFSREEAIRAAAARMIRIARASRAWENIFHGGLKGPRLAQLINWTRIVVARETGEQSPKPITIKEPPPVPRKTGLPLFDFYTEEI